MTSLGPCFGLAGMDWSYGFCCQNKECIFERVQNEDFGKVT